MYKKVLFIVAVCVFVLSSGAVNVFAAEGDSADCQFYNADEDVWVPGYCDGRINALDIDQTVAIYYDYETVQALDSNGFPYTTNAVSEIQLWAVDGDNVGHPVLLVSDEAINAAMASTSTVQVASHNGYTLNYAPATNTFWITAPDGYSFTWAAW